MLELQLEPSHLRFGPGARIHQGAASSKSSRDETSHCGSIALKVTVVVAAIFLALLSFLMMPIQLALVTSTVVVVGGGVGFGYGDKIVTFFSTLHLPQGRYQGGNYGSGYGNQYSTASAAGAYRTSPYQNNYGIPGENLAFGGHGATTHVPVPESTRSKAPFQSPFSVYKNPPRQPRAQQATGSLNEQFGGATGRSGRQTTPHAPFRGRATRSSGQTTSIDNSSLHVAWGGATGRNYQE